MTKAKKVFSIIDFRWCKSFVMVIRCYTNENQLVMNIVDLVFKHIVTKFILIKAFNKNSIKGLFWGDSKTALFMFRQIFLQEMLRF